MTIHESKNKFDIRTLEISKNGKKNEFWTQPIHPVMKESFINEMRFQINSICLSGQVGFALDCHATGPGIESRRLFGAAIKKNG